ncbi:hypothetical protein T265_05675 [Opisthorchis viverrini]|uniref:Band 3 cytoplasmic domain-containing protein n=1 Tax=Opisthorchis viverrini TaxID=6198 RepID=A0A074ZND9_OPIVI|nr:hypothetical protein T265_05675 [Opisthorchis viverrini]KER27272.1 hypothetical protein T265_05675 [Opisthorchis viverrini]
MSPQRKHEGWYTARLPKPRLGKSGGKGRVRSSNLPLDYLPPVFVELDILTCPTAGVLGPEAGSTHPNPASEQSAPSRHPSHWLETARWVRYEEDLDPLAGNFGQAHSPPLTFHAVVECRRYLEQGAIVLQSNTVGDQPPSHAAGYSGFVELDAAMRVLRHDCGATTEDVALIWNALRLRHHHVCDLPHQPLELSSNWLASRSQGLQFSRAVTSVDLQRPQNAGDGKRTASVPTLRGLNASTVQPSHHSSAVPIGQRALSLIHRALTPNGTERPSCTPPVQPRDRSSPDIQQQSSELAPSVVRAPKLGDCHLRVPSNKHASDLEGRLSPSTEVVSVQVSLTSFAWLMSYCTFSTQDEPHTLNVTFNFSGLKISAYDHDLLVSLPETHSSIFPPFHSNHNAQTMFVFLLFSQQQQVGVLPGLRTPLLVFLRLHRSLFIADFAELSDSYPIRFVVLFLGPDRRHLDYGEVGRVLATMMVDKAFRSVAYTASSRDDLLDGLRVFLDTTIVVPLLSDITPRSLLAMHDQIRLFRHSRQSGDTHKARLTRATKRSRSRSRKARAGSHHKRSDLDSTHLLGERERKVPEHHTSVGANTTGVSPARAGSHHKRSDLDSTHLLGERERKVPEHHTSVGANTTSVSPAIHQHTHKSVYASIVSSTFCRVRAPCTEEIDRQAAQIEIVNRLQEIEFSVSLIEHQLRKILAPLSQPSKEWIGTAVIPYKAGAFGDYRRLLNLANIRVPFQKGKTLRSILVQLKDPLPVERTRDCVYKINSND